MEYHRSLHISCWRPWNERDNLRVAIESWNQCNEVGEELSEIGSPRMADCFDIDNATSPGIRLIHKVDNVDNKLGMLNGSYGEIKAKNIDVYAAEKEIYLGKKCQVEDEPRPWHFWMIMLKSDNMDTLAAICPENGKKSKPFQQDSRFPCFGKGCMNMPSMYHDYTYIQGNDNNTLRGSFYGTWDLDANVKNGVIDNDVSYYNVTWGFLVCIIIRQEACRKLFQGHPLRFSLNITKGGGPKSQFYLLDMGSCWKNNGKPCDGDVNTDVTRYSEMIINPNVEAWCKPDHLDACPPYHTLPNGTWIHRTNKNNFPYDACHIYCSPGNAEHIEEPYNLYEAYSNPQPQEILQILPHEVWGEYGYPTKKGEGWIGDPRTWELDVGRLSQALYFYQDPGTKPVERHLPSIDLGVEIYISNDEIAEWTVSDFDIIIPKESIW
ncbi:hypothetical protein CRYUN_Cryun26dG0113100 [Craigia yunnanensis]